MGEHRHNPTAIKAMNGEIAPKAKPHLTKRQQEAVLRALIREKTSTDALLDAAGVNYIYR